MQILQSFMEKIASAQMPRKPEELGDALALRTEWKTFNKVTANFNTHHLVENPGYGVSYKPAFSFYFLGGIFIAFGIGAIVITLGSGLQSAGYEQLMTKDTGMLVLFGGVFAGIGVGILKFMRRKLVFDQIERCMIDRGQDRTYFSDIYALQILPQRGNQYTNYQVNLVRHDAGRIYVMNYADKKTARMDAARIADMMGVPVNRIWDMLPGHADQKDHV